MQQQQNIFQVSERFTESCYTLIDGVQESLDRLKDKRMSLDLTLSTVLAKKESLRKKDYNSLMADIYQILDEKEKSAKNQFISFIEDQKEFVRSLKMIIVNIDDLHSPDSTEDVVNLRNRLSEISIIQEERKNKVTMLLTNVQDSYRKTLDYLESLVEKGDNIQIHDIKKIRVLVKECIL